MLKNRKKQLFPTSVAPNLTLEEGLKWRKMAEKGIKPGQAQLYLAMYKKQDVSYVSEEAREICEVQQASSQTTMDEFEISPNDAIGEALGKEYPGMSSDARSFGGWW